ncbi:hypothetical protein SAMN05443575_2675 [Jatrophihabitans endophyticus]|uniref:Amine oxidase domain-containing protein n=1 Tax=Jatrophihabitans endophyticus TaxID=1206085 RepID=A0A1M5MAK6_9ACTN|nr:FAD-dependent oxidoreductase [Jatrophihabitans endophyticus]SHG74322.1 hypothetical protein SAMN05443575_2675 [Jatrophihabitans endophyticus]
MTARVAVVGAGMAGAACARVLADRGIDVTVVERGRAPGGRMAAPVLHGRRVDLGAAYLTAKDDGFAALVADWVARGLAREWTDTFTVLGDDGRSTTSGPMRYAAPDGLRSLVRDVLPVPAELGTELVSAAELDHDAVVLAMPDPQARRLVPDASDWVEFDPVVSVAAGWSRREWEPFDAAFVNDHPAVSLIADDGARRGDGAAVLVAHAVPDLARCHLDAPDAVVPLLLDAMGSLLGATAAPEWTHAQRWTFAKPVGTHGDEPFGLTEYAGRPLGLCTDTWCPQGAPRVESAWLSGHHLGQALADRLA